MIVTSLISSALISELKEPQSSSRHNRFEDTKFHLFSYAKICQYKECPTLWWYHTSTRRYISFKHPSCLVWSWNCSLHFRFHWCHHRSSYFPLLLPCEASTCWKQQQSSVHEPNINAPWILSNAQMVKRWPSSSNCLNATSVGHRCFAVDILNMLLSSIKQNSDRNRNKKSQ